jgi:hypothetical protein
MTASPLDADSIAAFERDGFLVQRGAVRSAVVERCADVVWSELTRQGVRRDDPSTWTKPVVRIVCPEGECFADAGTSPPLWEAYDALLGAGRWKPRLGVGGTIPVRFPSDEDPGDAGWHIDGSYEVDGEYWVNVHSRDRGLLALFLLSDVGPADAPTRILVGSHLDVPSLLVSAGERGMPFLGGDRIPAHTRSREVAFATGAAGDVFLCHPFLVHAATWPHRGHAPRLVAQPAVALHTPFALTSMEGVSPVERVILRSLAR